MFTLSEDEVAILQDVNESTRRCDDDLAAHAETHSLLLTRQTADNGHRADAQRLAELDRLLLDLLGQFTRRGQDDGVRARLIVSLSHTGTAQI